MATTPSSVRVPARNSGPAMRTFTDPEGKEVQGVTLVDTSGVNVGGEDNGLHVIATSFEHFELHEGDSFVASHLVSSLGSGSSHDHLVITPDTAKLAHHIWEVIATAEAELYLYEDTNSTGGTPITAFNRFRDSTNAAAVTVAHTPSITSVGTQIWLGLVGAGNKTGGGERSINEFILAQNTKYLFRVTSRTAGCKIVIRHDWYEHTFGA